MTTSSLDPASQTSFEGAEGTITFGAGMETIDCSGCRVTTELREAQVLIGSPLEPETIDAQTEPG